MNSKANLSEVNEFSLTLNEPITDSEADRIRMTHLAEYFKMEYNDALVYKFTITYLSINKLYN